MSPPRLPVRRIVAAGALAVALGVVTFAATQGQAGAAPLPSGASVVQH